MKAASFAFAAVFALTGAAFAGDKDARTAKSTVKPVQQEQVLDPTTTGSIRSNDQKPVKSPRIGIELNPFSFGAFH